MSPTPKGRESAKPAESGEQVTEEAARTAAQGAEAGAETMRRGTEAATGAMMEGADQAADLGRRQVEWLRSFYGIPADTYRDMAETGRDDIDAFVRSSARLARGFQEMSVEMVNFTQDNLRSGLRAANDMMRCRTFEDVVAAQRDFLREAMDRWMQESAKLLEIGGNAANEASRPIQRKAGGD